MKVNSSQSLRVKFSAILLGTLSLVLTNIAPVQADNQPTHWSYGGHENPTVWGDLSPEFATCKVGHNQSPIDIHAVEIEPIHRKASSSSTSIDFDYHPARLEVLNNGHTIQVNHSGNSSIRIGDQKYELLQFHFHTPSEHTIEGEAYAMELHLVHRNSSGEYAVVGVLMDVGQKNSLLKTIWSHIPEEGEVNSVDSVFINPNSFLPRDLAHYTYAGSLTTPPCSENVSWYLMRKPIEVSEEQIEQFHTIFNVNARPVQPLYGRVIKLEE